MPETGSHFARVLGVVALAVGLVSALTGTVYVNLENRLDVVEGIIGGHSISLARLIQQVEAVEDAVKHENVRIDDCQSSVVALKQAVVSRRFAFTIEERGLLERRLGDVERGVERCLGIVETLKERLAEHRQDDKTERKKVEARLTQVEGDVEKLSTVKE